MLKQIVVGVVVVGVLIFLWNVLSRTYKQLFLTLLIIGLIFFIVFKILVKRFPE